VFPLEASNLPSIEVQQITTSLFGFGAGPTTDDEAATACQLVERAGEKQS
jgi:hypothetical protein